MNFSVWVRLRHKYLVPLVSYVPGPILKMLMKWFPRVGQDYDDGIGWNFWLDASYYAWVRKDKKKNEH